jgi:hypothetical protein
LILFSSCFLTPSNEQNLLQRFSSSVAITSVYDAGTAAAVVALQTHARLSPTGVFDEPIASVLLGNFSHDGYRDDGRPPRALGYKYKVHVQVHVNRSIEPTARLLDGYGNEIFSFVTRLHGVDSLSNANTWPYFNSSGDGLNEFSSDGNTPTGLAEFDLNSPEDDPIKFGPYPVNRVVQGLKGNAAFLLINNESTTVRDGILMHTGAWSNYSNWEPPAPMPNSLGCIHAWCVEQYSSMKPSSVVSVVQKLRKSHSTMAYSSPPLSLCLFPSPRHDNPGRLALRRCGSCS